MVQNEKLGGLPEEARRGRGKRAKKKRKKKERIQPKDFPVLLFLVSFCASVQLVVEWGVLSWLLTMLLQLTLLLGLQSLIMADFAAAALS